MVVLETSYDGLLMKVYPLTMCAMCLQNLIRTSNKKLQKMK